MESKEMTLLSSLVENLEIFADYRDIQFSMLIYCRSLGIAREIFHMLTKEGRNVELTFDSVLRKVGTSLENSSSIIILDDENIFGRFMRRSFPFVVWFDTPLHPRHNRLPATHRVRQYMRQNGVIEN